MVGGFPGCSMGKNLPANAEDTRDEGLILGLGRSPGGGNGNLLQYSCLGNRLAQGKHRISVSSYFLFFSFLFSIVIDFFSSLV